MNTTMSAVLAFLVVLLLAPALPGVATRTRAALTGRKGAPALQLYYDLWKLVRRGAVYSDGTTVVFRLAPIAIASTALLAAAIVPFDGRASLVHFSGDVVAFAYVLGLGRFVLVLGALDTGSSFEGMGASREVTFSSLVEVGLFLSLGVLGVVTRELSLTGMLGESLSIHWQGNIAAPVMIAVSLFALLLAECARVPVDDPATHLELTMIHEVMILDNSGPDLALLHYGSALKFAIFGALVVGVLAPRANLGPAGAIAVLGVGLLAIGAAVGVVEATIARLRMPKVPLYLAGASSLALFSLILALWNVG